MRRPFVLTLLALVAGLVPLPTHAQEPGALPKGETVLADFIEATGGKAAYEKLKNRVSSGTAEFAGANITGKFQVFEAAPNMASAVLDLGAHGKGVEGTDGKDAWEVSVEGERLLEGEEKEDTIREATFNDELHRKELYDKIECVGVEEVEGKPAYKVVFTPKSGKPMTEFYDKASHLLVKSISTSKSPKGEITVESIRGDYKRVDGILLPFTITEKALGQQLTVKFTEIKHNVDIPADTFKRPASLAGAEKKKAD